MAIWSWTSPLFLSVCPKPLLRRCPVPGPEQGLAPNLRLNSCFKRGYHRHVRISISGDFDFWKTFKFPEIPVVILVLKGKTSSAFSMGIPPDSTIDAYDSMFYPSITKVHIYSSWAWFLQRHDPTSREKETTQPWLKNAASSLVQRAQRKRSS